MAARQKRNKPSKLSAFLKSEDCEHTTTKIERIQLICSMDKHDEILKIFFDEGWRIPHMGPYTNKDMFPRCDTSRLQILAERVLGEDI